jgi:hypothetical protein
VAWLYGATAVIGEGIDKNFVAEQPELLANNTPPTTCDVKWSFRSLAKGAAQSNSFAREKEEKRSNAEFISKQKLCDWENN